MAPCPGVDARAATSKADCDSAQGQAIHSAPAQALRAGPMTMRCQAPVCAVTGAVSRCNQRGHSPRHNIHKPQASAARCNKVHSGRSTGASDSPSRKAPTLHAASAPPAA